MAGLINDYSVERDALLYVMSENGKPKGWRTDLLVKKLSESEEQLLLCNCCNGLSRNACFYEEELRCGLCIAEGVAWLPVKKIRKLVIQKMVIYLLYLYFRPCKIYNLFLIPVRANFTPLVGIHFIHTPPSGIIGP